ncbi:MAG: NADAR family protein [Candidatus Pacebacteria bacterium]|nr:NADAR family protein [Candidatus Paceibacterota bacterium]
MIKEFQNEYRWLSNMFPVEIPFQGHTYRSVEHAYQAQKSKEISWKMFCTQEIYPKIVKKKSHEISLRLDWEEVKLGIMEELLFLKFSQKFFQTKLLETKDQEIQEGNDWDDVFWGVDKMTGIGENHLGKLIMKVREKLRK